MAQIEIYQVDAFTDRPFCGNPAAVCLLEEKLSNEEMRSIASEMNLSETAFVRPLNDASFQESEEFTLRWFTPEVEVPLCGHATLATSWVLFEEIENVNDTVTFSTKSGNLSAEKREGVVLDFPTNTPTQQEPSQEILDGLGIVNYEDSSYSADTNKLLIALSSEDRVKNLNPDFSKLSSIVTDIRGIIVTAKGEDGYDFVSRYFAPWVGIDEDPVTGSAHTVLAPYWSTLLNKKEMKAYQASDRGGKLTVRIKDDRTELEGKAVTVLEGNLFIWSVL
ncbi:MAG: PhzF family phenazine biosynthesis protein [Thermoplasmatota archaeon]